jgi:uncharacterized membrane protein
MLKWKSTGPHRGDRVAQVGRGDGMIDNLLIGLMFLCALGCGLIAGAFFAFSTFVMKALARIPPAQGIAAMQSINIVVLNPWFLGLFLGTSLACVVVSLLAWSRPGAAWVIAGSLLYLVGTILVTMRCNVPRNDRLERSTLRAQTAVSFGQSTFPVGPRGTTCGPLLPRRRRPALSWGSCVPQASVA